MEAVTVGTVFSLLVTFMRLFQLLSNSVQGAVETAHK